MITSTCTGYSPNLPLTEASCTGPNVSIPIIIIIIIIYSYSKPLGQWYSYLQVLIKAITKYTGHSIKTNCPLLRGLIHKYH